MTTQTGQLKEASCF